MCLKTLVLCLDLCIWHGTKEALRAFKTLFSGCVFSSGFHKEHKMLKVQELEVRKSMCTLEMNTNLTWTGFFIICKLWKASHFSCQIPVIVICLSQQLSSLFLLSSLFRTVLSLSLCHCALTPYRVWHNGAFSHNWPLSSDKHLQHLTSYSSINSLVWMRFLK